jgi:hypothetical protein
MTVTHRLWTCFVILITLRQALSLDVTLQNFKESPGLYYDHVGEAQLYNTEWEIVTYVNLDEADRNVETAKKYDQLSADFCKNHKQTFWINFTDCMKTIPYAERQLKEVEDMKLLVRQVTTNDDDNTYDSKE